MIKNKYLIIFTGISANQLIYEMWLKDSDAFSSFVSKFH